MNILVTGSGGQLGRQIRKLSEGRADHFVFADICPENDSQSVFLDICDRDAVELVMKSEHIGLLINCAAYTAVDKAEDDVSYAELLNSRAVENMAEICRDCGATLIHISTDYVFDGEINRPLTESDEPSPLSVYGATKLASEIAIRQSGCKYLIFRTSWLYSEYGRNFLKTMRTLMSERKELNVVYDQVGSPTYAGDLAQALLQVIERRDFDKTGLYHYSNEGAVSWYDFAQHIRRAAGLDCVLHPILSSEYPTRAERPHYSVLDKSLFKSTFGIEIPYWADSLDKCMKEL